jgi:alpha-L-fucosidase
LTIEWDEEKDISRIWLAEVDFAHVREFFLDAKQGEQWQEIARGTTIGANKVIEIPTTRAKQIRLRITQVAGPININEFQVYSPK